MGEERFNLASATLTGFRLQCHFSLDVALNGPSPLPPHPLVTPVLFGCLLDAARSDGLPKTRSGKVMRRVLRKIAAGAHVQL